MKKLFDSVLVAAMLMTSIPSLGQACAELWKAPPALTQPMPARLPEVPSQLALPAGKSAIASADLSAFLQVLAPAQK